MEACSSALRQLDIQLVLGGKLRRIERTSQKTGHFACGVVNVHLPNFQHVRHASLRHVPMEVKMHAERL